tara:strand:+ start:832 stop:1299 length:468 start_codon:yes stop_codon:yes gene_type:complete
MDIDQWENAAQAFECSLMILRKDKNGWVVGVSVHPNDVPTTLLDAPLGSRFQAVLFQIGDDEKPVELTDIKAGKRLLAEAGELCRKPTFQEFIMTNDMNPQGRIVNSDPESIAADCLRRFLGVSSRSEIATNKDVQEKYKTLAASYRESGLDLPF